MSTDTPYERLTICKNCKHTCLAHRSRTSSLGGCQVCECDKEYELRECFVGEIPESFKEKKKDATAGGGPSKNQNKLSGKHGSSGSKGKPKAVPRKTVQRGNNRTSVAGPSKVAAINGKAGGKQG